MKRMIPLLFILALVETSHAAGRLSGYECALKLNALASAVLNTNVTMRWIGGHSENMRFGWVRLSEEAFALRVTASGVPVGTEQKINAALKSLLLTPAEVSQATGDEPALLAHKAATKFLNIHRQPDLYASFVVRDVVDAFYEDTNVLHVHDQQNFEFADDRNCCEYSLRGVSNLSLQREQEAFLFREISMGPGDVNLHRWIADLLAAVSKWNDLELLNRAVKSASQGKIDLDGVAGINKDGRVTLASTYFGLFTETRAEAVRSWALHKLINFSWESAWEEGQARAVATVSTYSDPEVLAPYLALPNGIYVDHTMPLRAYLNQ